MPSPFPGMDPYIEAAGLWEDFHSHLIEKIYDALAENVPDRYLVRTGERSYVVLVGAEGKESHSFLPDVAVTSRSGEGSSGKAKSATALAGQAEGGPIAVRPFIEEEYRETFVEILEAEAEQRLVTCIEVLSPSNKRRGTPGWDLYLRKRQALLLGEANLVEIDLLRGGQRLPMLDPWPDSPYTVLVSRRWKTPRCLVWPASFQRPLPVIPVPLARPDPEVELALQPMVEGIYARSRYHHSIDYSRPLSPPPTPEESAWLAQLAGRGSPAKSTGGRKRRRGG
jgi:hypothetical protein